MRMMVIDKKMDLRALGNQLLDDEAGRGSALDKLKNLNPHVDFINIEPGTVLLIPDAAGFRDADSFSVTGDAFDALREQMVAAVDAAASRLRAGFDALLAEQKEVAAVLKSAAARRAIEADPDLKPQIEAAAQVFKQDQQQARDAEKTLQALQEQAAAELESLARLLG